MPAQNEPKRMPAEARQAPPPPRPKKAEAKRTIKEFHDPEETPIPSDEGWTDAGDDDDPEFDRARAEQAARMAELAKSPADPDPRRFTEAMVRELSGDANPMRTVVPETLDQQTPRPSDIPSAYPGNMGRVSVVSTDPSKVQTMHPAGEAANFAPDPQYLLDLVPGLKEMIAAQVAAAVELAAGKKEAKTMPLFAGDPSIPWKPSKYLVHFRNDINPRKSVQRRAIDKSSDRLYDEPEHKGEKLQFVNGHFFATEQWQVDQLNWMMKHPTHNNVGDVVGGDPGIWIDDDDPDVMYCPECRAPFASVSKLLAHRKATHNVALA